MLESVSALRSGMGRKQHWQRMWLVEEGEQVKGGGGGWEEGEGPTYVGH